MYASILGYHFEKKTKPTVYKNASPYTPELIPGSAFQFQNICGARNNLSVTKSGRKRGLWFLP